MSYPVLLLRIKAAMLDSVILAVLLFTLSYVSIELGISTLILKLLFIFVPVVLFEPTMIWITGGSIGHHYSGIRVISKRSGNNLFILNGIVRFFTKTLLGWISLLLMFLTRRHQSLHDILSGSLVVFKNEDTAVVRHKLKGRQTVYTTKKPSLGRRLGVVVAYLLLVLMIYSVFMNVFVSTNCLELGRCGELENTIFTISTLILLVALLGVMILGFLCKLPGAYYRAENSA